MVSSGFSRAIVILQIQKEAKSALERALWLGLLPHGVWCRMSLRKFLMSSIIIAYV